MNLNQLLRNQIFHLHLHMIAHRPNNVSRLYTRLLALTQPICKAKFLHTARWLRKNAMRSSKSKNRSKRKTKICQSSLLWQPQLAVLKAKALMWITAGKTMELDLVKNSSSCTSLLYLSFLCCSALSWRKHQYRLRRSHPQRLSLMQIKLPNLSNKIHLQLQRRLTDWNS